MIQKCIPFALVQLGKITAKEHHRPLQYTQAGPKRTGYRRTFQTFEDCGNQVQEQVQHIGKILGQNIKIGRACLAHVIQTSIPPKPNRYARTIYTHSTVHFPIF